jgi:prepilin-type N-terminal cleavage/methylation domain-containing protein
VSARRSHGFTLLEVIVAIVVFATVMSLLIQLVTQNLRRTADARDELRAARLAEGKLREILFQAESGELPDPGASQGSFEGDDEDMAFEIKVDNFGIPLPQGAAKQVVPGSGLFVGGGKPALRMVTVKVFPANSDLERISPVPFVAFMAEPNPAAEPAPEEGQEQAEQSQDEQSGDPQPGIDDSSQEVVDQ